MPEYAINGGAAMDKLLIKLGDLPFVQPNQFKLECSVKYLNHAKTGFSLTYRHWRSKGFLLALCGFAFGMHGTEVLAEQPRDSVQLRQPASNCQPYANTQPICLFTNPEDLAVLPGNKVLIVSEYGDMRGTRAGALASYDIAKQQRLTLFDGGDLTVPTEYWGESSCTQPPGLAFSPHGIDLTKRSDGRWQLLVVQHGGRESVEFFEVLGAETDAKLVWRGCAIAPKAAQLNSVAAGNAGQFYTTNMQSSGPAWDAVNVDSLEATGVVYRWHKDSGYEPVPSSQGKMLNGLAAARDSNTIYVVYSADSLLKKIDADTGAVLASTTVRSPDNVKWSADGKSLLAASFVGTEGVEAFMQCMAADVEICPITFAIVELSPETLSKHTLFENPGAPMGGGTVGLKVDSTLFIGSFSGNRILQVDLKNATR